MAVGSKNDYSHKLSPNATCLAGLQRNNYTLGVILQSHDTISKPE